MMSFSQQGHTEREYYGESAAAPKLIPNYVISESWAYSDK